MATLRDLSTINSPSGRGRDGLGVVLQSSPFLAFMETTSGWEEDATVFDWLPVATALATIDARGIGGSYTAMNAAPGTRLTGQLAMHGGSVDIDISHLADARRGLRDVDAWFAKELQVRLKAFAVGYEKLLFEGTGESNQIKGLRNIINGSDLPGFTDTTRLADAQEAVGGSAKSCDLTNTNNYGKFIEYLYAQIVKVDNPAGLVMNTSLYARMWTIARKEQILGETRDLFGVPVATFNGIPMIRVLDGTITNSEPDNDTTPKNETTSLYIMSPGERRVSLVTNSGLYWIDYDHVDNKESGREKWEIRAAWKVEDPMSVLRVRNIKV